MDICSTNGLLPANSNIIDCIKSDKYKKNDLITKPNLISDRFIYLQRIYLLSQLSLFSSCKDEDTVAELKLDRTAIQIKEGSEGILKIESGNQRRKRTGISVGDLRKFLA